MATNRTDHSVPSHFLIDQINAASDVYKAIQDLTKQQILNSQIPEHKAILETDVFRLRRGLCLPSACATAINVYLSQRLFVESGKPISIGDLFRILLPFHGTEKLEELPKGWLVVTNSGDMYHHTFKAIANSLSMPCSSVFDIKDFQDFIHIHASGAKIAVSLNNRVVIEQTLSRIPNAIKQIDNFPHINIQGLDGQTSYQRFEEGRHVVTILDINSESVTIADSFNLPQTHTHGIVFTSSIKDMNKYLINSDTSPSRAIIFGEHPKSEKFKYHPLIVPVKIQQKITSQINSLLN